MKRTNMYSTRAPITSQHYTSRGFILDSFNKMPNRDTNSHSGTALNRATMPSAELKIRDVAPSITIFSVPFNRFAPFGYREFVAVGNRATAIRLHDGRILLLNPIPLEQAVRDKLDQLGGVHLVACDLGHHMYAKAYVEAWPEAKIIGVPGLEGKRKDVRWDYIYEDWRTSPEDQFDFAQDIETVLFEGFITYCVAWYHKPTRTMIQSDLMMNLPCTEVRLHTQTTIRPPCTSYLGGVCGWVFGVASQTANNAPAILSELIGARSVLSRVCKARASPINLGKATRVSRRDR